MSGVKRLLALLSFVVIKTVAYAATQNYDIQPAKPEDFGYKINWFAVKSTDSKAVAMALQLDDGVHANWPAGVAAAYSDNNEKSIFVSPSTHGWVLVIGSSLPYPVANSNKKDELAIGKKFNILLSRLTSHFEEVQFFGSHRVVGFVSWVRAINGHSIREFSFADGTVYANSGAHTEAETELHIPDISNLLPDAAADRLLSENSHIPDEDDVIKLVGLWSIDPGKLSHNAASTDVGLVIRLPKELAQ